MSDETQNNPSAVSDKPPPISFAEFLESVPPSEFREVADAIYEFFIQGRGQVRQLAAPEIRLHCSNAICNGPRIFRFKNGERSCPEKVFSKTVYFTYICSNCQRFEKVYSLRFLRSEKTEAVVGAMCYKYGEYPNYGPPTPTRLLRLFGKDREIFLKGRQCEKPRPWDRCICLLSACR